MQNNQKTGVYYDMPEEEYHASDALSNSGMKTILHKSPRHYQYQYLEGNQKDTAALAFGRALHCAVLEPEKFDAEYVIEPDVNMSTKAGASEYLKWIAGITGDLYFLDSTTKMDEIREQIGEMKQRLKLNIINASFAEMIADICASIKAKRSAVSLLQMDGRNEVSFFCEYDGVMLRARMDRVLGAHVGIDLKSCQDASPEGFERAAYNYGYHMQAYFYSWIYEQVTGEQMKDFVFICVEKEAPHCVGLYRASPEMLELGKLDVEKAINIYKESQKRGIWFDYDDRIIPLGLPRYAENRLTYGE